MPFKEKKRKVKSENCVKTAGCIFWSLKGLGGGVGVEAVGGLLC